MQQYTTDPTDNFVFNLLDLLARFRLVSEEQLCAYFDREVLDLETLEDHRVIVIRKVPLLEGEPIRLVALTRHGAKTLAMQTGQDSSEMHSFTPSTLKRSLFTVEHSLAITELGLALFKLESSEGVSLIHWETSPQKIGDSVILETRKGFIRVPLVADAFFGLSQDGAEQWFLVEVDRGTTTIPRMKRKLEGYSLWWRNRGHVERFGVKNLRLLTIVSTEKRLQKLIEATVDVTEGKGAGFFWFTLQENISIKKPEKLFSEIWRTAKEPNYFQSLHTRCSGP